MISLYMVIPCGKLLVSSVNVRLALYNNITNILRVRIE